MKVVPGMGTAWARRRRQKILSGSGAWLDGQGFCRVVGGSRAVGVWGSVPGYSGLKVSSAGTMFPGIDREHRHCAAPQKVQPNTLHGNAASRDDSRMEKCSLSSGVGWGTHTLVDIFVSWIYRTY